MRIGIPSETKTLEGRVALVPYACGDLVKAGHEVAIQSGAGDKSGFSDADFSKVGVKVVPDAPALFDFAELVVKVKEPIAGDLQHLTAHHRLFCYLHLAAEPALTQSLKDIGLTAVAFETVEESGGQLPLLAPMSIIAGRIAVQVGTHLLHQPQGGRGILLGGLGGAERGHIVVLGAGAAGGHAASLAAAGGARVTVFDKRTDRLESMMAVADNISALYPYNEAVAEACAEADLVIGAVLVTGARAPHVVTRDMVRGMAEGSVMIDISVDQGGCFETTKPTTYQDPTYVVDGVTHFAVTNMPGAVPRTSSQALSAAILPYVMKMARPDWRNDQALVRGINVDGGSVVHPALEAVA